MDDRSRTALFQALEHDGVDEIQRLREELAFTKARIPPYYRDLQPGQSLHFNWDMERERALQDFVNKTLLFACESLVPEVCAMPLEMFAVQGEHIDNWDNREWRKTKHIKEHTQKTYLINLDFLWCAVKGTMLLSTCASSCPSCTKMARPW